MITFIFFIIILFYSIVFHEIAHGYAAYRNGDMTALNAGRLTLNPIRHIDPIGSILVPIIAYFIFGFSFGWAKPVPYNSLNIKDKKYGELEVASAGVITNIFLAIFAVFTYYFLESFSILNADLKNILVFTTNINIFLAVFNLLPFPPADGFSIFSELFRVNRALSQKIKSLFYNPISMFIVIFVAVNVFSLLIPYLFKFVQYLYSFYYVYPQLLFIKDLSFIYCPF